MKSFLYKVVIFILSITLVIGAYIVLIIFHPEYIDMYYRRFTTPRAHSLVIGTSRAGVGIQPDIINKKIFQGNPVLYNHAFALGMSNYGPLYLKEIKQKIDTSECDFENIFIVSVDPWGLSEGTDNMNKPEDLWENKNPIAVGNLKRSDINPNLEYLYKFWGNRFSPFKEIFKQTIDYSNVWTLENNGWVFINVPMDEKIVNDRIQQGIEGYKQKKLAYNDVRFQYLEETIKFLKRHGNVYMVRIPVTKPMYEYENEKFPDFENRMKIISEKYGVKFINMFHDTTDYKFVDVHHLFSTSAEKLTDELGDSILNDLNSFHRINNVTSRLISKEKLLSNY